MAELTELIYSVSSGTPGVVQVGQGIFLWQSQFKFILPWSRTFE